MDSLLTLEGFKAAPLLPFRIKNIDVFLNQEHPNFHPETQEYDDYWEKQTERCILGHWGYDYNEKEGGGWRWIPGRLYFYVNMCVIKMEGRSGAEISAPPQLRDIDWLIGYTIAQCGGFSGFSGDKEYSCFLPLKKVENGDELTGKDKYLLRTYDEEIRTPSGEYKKFVEPREYLYQTFSEPMGEPQWFNESRNLILLSSRGVGKSFSIAGQEIAYDWTFSGAKTVDDFFEGRTSITVVVGSADSSKSDELLTKVSSIFEHLRTSVGAYYSADHEESGYFYQRPYGSPKCGKALTTKGLLEGKVGYSEDFSKIAHVTYKNNMSAGVGHRSKQIIEEAGLLDNFDGVHSENKPTQERDTKFTYSIYIGTGGDVKKIKGIRGAFYNPDAYDAVSFDNSFSKSKGNIGLFIPAYYRKSIFRDENGNTNYQEAFNDEITERRRLLSLSEKKYEEDAISYPIVPEEMFMQSAGNKMPTAKIQSRIAVLEAGLWKKMATTGELIWLDKERRTVRFNKDMRPRKGIYAMDDERGMSAKEMEGRIVIYEPPPEEPEYRRKSNPMYIVAYDPVESDGEGSSLACVKVFKTWEPKRGRIQYNIVAEWYGRYPKIEGNHEIALKLACYYNCMVLPEVNKFDFVRHCRKTSKYAWLQPKPTLAISGMINQKKQYDVGIHISPGMKPHAETYLAELLETIVDKHETIEKDRYVVKEVKMVELCPSLRFLEECRVFNHDDNFDGVSTMMLVAIWIREQKLGVQDPDETEHIQDQSSSLRELINLQDSDSVRDGFAFDY